MSSLPRSLRFPWGGAGGGTVNAQCGPGASDVRPSRSPSGGRAVACGAQPPTLGRVKGKWDGQGRRASEGMKGMFGAGKCSVGLYHGRHWSPTCPNPQRDRDVHCGLWVKGQRRPVGCDRRRTPMGGGAAGTDVHSWGRGMGRPVCSLPFCCEPRTAPKRKSTKGKSKETTSAEGIYKEERSQGAASAHGGRGAASRCQALSQREGEDQEGVVPKPCQR